MRQLDVELVPSTSWGNNLRKIVSSSKWDQIRKKAYKEADYKCEVCGGVGTRWPVECHEQWHYNESTGQQLLVGVEALCPNCHLVKHIGRAFEVGEGDRALAHLCKVNNINEETAMEYINGVFRDWQRRSSRSWTVDISFIDNWLGASE